MNRRDREQRAREVREALRRAWRAKQRVELTLQRGRQRPRVAGRVVYVATSGAYALVDDGGDGCPPLDGGFVPEPLHVPVDAVRAVDVAHRKGLRRVVPNPHHVPEREGPR